jgi:hypothetical protein
MREFIQVTETLTLTQEEIDLIEEKIAYLEKYPQPELVLVSQLVEKVAEQREEIQLNTWDVITYIRAKYPHHIEGKLPPLTLTGGYDLVLQHPSLSPNGCYKRSDGSILYAHRWWSTTSRHHGNREYAYFQVKDEFGIDYQQVTPWKGSTPERR